MCSLNKGSEYRSAQQLIECLWAYEDWMHEKKIERDADCVARAAALRARPDPNVEGDADQRVCTVCMTSERSFLLIPCGHLAVCQSC